ncbi:MAG: hypothetical protein ACRCU1_11125 [Alsobacter sp.]
MTMPGRSTLSDDDLMALADGELSPERATAMRAQLAMDVVAAERFADFVEARALAHAILVEPTSAPAAAPPARPGPRPASAHPGTMPRRRFDWRVALAAAAGLVVGVPLGIAVLNLGPPESDGRHFAQDADLIRALSTLASGQTTTVGAAVATILATHRTGSGTICREVLLSEGPEGQARPVSTFVGCRAGGTWRVIAAFPEPVAGGFAPASGQDLADGLLRSLGSPGALSVQDEASALR